MDTPKYKTLDLPAESIHAAMQTLKMSLGWQYLSEIIEVNEIIKLRAELEEGEQDSLEKVNNLRYKLNCFKFLLALPDVIIEDYKPKEQNSDKDEDVDSLNENEDGDPYQTVEETEQERTESSSGG